MRRPNNNSNHFCRHEMITENQLETWSKQGPTAQFTSTYEGLRNCLNDTNSPYYPKSFEIFLQGSYKNDTNVYGDSDVDVVIRLDSTYYSDLDQLTEGDRTRFEAQRVPATYSLEEFKSAVVSWLTKKYGSDVKPGTKAIFVKGNGARRDADVLVCAKLRRFHSFPAYGQPSQVDGVCFFLPDGARIENFPEKHSANCTIKNQGTNQWFKHTVRIFKNIRNALVKQNTIADGSAPSYFIEGMLYNVPNPQFGGTEQRNIIDVFNWLDAADRSKFVCANEQFYLFGNSHVTWSVAKCEAFLSAIKQFWNNS